MKKLPLLLILPAVVFSCAESTSTEEAVTEEAVETETVTELVLNTLLRDTLTLASGTEVIVSHVQVPPNTALPAHYHPGEEFPYLISGSGMVAIADGPETLVEAGFAGKVPYKTKHTFRSLEEGAELVVFRVHEKGQPERVMIEEKN